MGTRTFQHLAEVVAFMEADRCSQAGKMGTSAQFGTRGKKNGLGNAPKPHKIEGHPEETRK